ncbi:hypothetical protein HZ500_000872 [Salmonella enterica]|nr:hypothetical protein [Salmonella enterica subsp. diarizonae]EDQ8491269.1 hypothetical protein [Salmonella enterica]EIF7171016.1 hypothetical protein [Salmonella enterica]EIF8862508.1 hypothetical protein [Salmonella enterica]
MKAIGQTLLILGVICIGLTIIGWMNHPSPALFIIAPMLLGGFCVLIGSVFTVGGAIVDELREQRKD